MVILGFTYVFLSGLCNGLFTAPMKIIPRWKWENLAAAGAGVLSDVFNVGYSLALPIVDAGEALGYSRFDATNCIWLLMLGAGAIPNIAYCGCLMRTNRTAHLLTETPSGMTWGLSVLMGLLWGSITFLYGAATPRLGGIGPSIGWPLSLAVALLVANLMGVLLKEWRGVDQRAVLRQGIVTPLAAIILCGASSSL